MLSKNLAFHTDVSTLHELSSDHFPILIEVDADVTRRIPKQKFNISKIDL